MKSLKESLLSDIEDTLNIGNANIDARCRLNWRMTHYDTKNFKIVPGGRKTIVEKYFGKKIEPVYASTHVSFSKNFNLAEKNKKPYKTPASWFEAIILNTKFDSPIDDVLKNRTYAPYKPIDDRLEYEFNSRLLPEYRKLYEEGNPIIHTYTRWMHRPYRTEVIVTVFLTSDVLKVDIDADYGKLCEITFLYNEDDKKFNKLDESSLLDDIEDTLINGDNFANLQDWIDNFKNLSAMSANVSNFVKEIKKNGAKPAYDAAIENGKYFVEIIKGDNNTIFSYTLKFYYPDKNEKDYWNYVIIRMQVPRNKLLERKGYKKEIKFLNVEMLKTSISYIKQEVARCISSRTNKMYILPDKYKGIINLIKIEDKK